MARLYVPSPVIAGVTSHSTHVFSFTTPIASIAAALMGGALLQVNPSSLQGVAEVA